MKVSMNWRVRVLGCASLFLLPWMVMLALTLRNPTGWVLLDLGESLSLAGTAVLLHRGSGWHRLLAAAAALLLLTDAGADIGSSTTTGDLLMAVAEAAIGELPMAALCASLVLRRRRAAGPADAGADARPASALAA
jgi:hypothetical protein